ncbi:MAG TPA: hypothetical protein VK667_11955, partial [Ktedonobacteraceae bacterium]|nr:hypothetical protein [Ktedonobacteraceae bacterium]
MSKHVKALIFGAGAQGRVILDILRAQSRYDSIEFIDDNETLWGQFVNGAPVAGNFDYAHQQDQGTSRMIIAVGNPVLRLSIARKAREYAIPFLNAVHPSSVIMPTVTLGEGNMISALAVINSNSVIGDNV